MAFYKLSTPAFIGGKMCYAGEVVSYNGATSSNMTVSDQASYDAQRAQDTLNLRPGVLSNSLGGDQLCPGDL